MNKPAFYSLDDENRIKAATLANEANAMLAMGTPLERIPRDNLLAYCVMRELDMSIALTELARRDEGVQGAPDASTGYLQ